MEEQLQQILRILRLAWPYRWVALVVSAVICAVGWAWVYSLPNEYRVEAKVYVDTRSILRPLLRGIALDNSVIQDSAALMKRTLLTRPNLEEVARRTDMDLTARTPKEFDILVTRMAKRVSVVGTRQNDIFQIAYTDSDPRLAKKVVDELLNTFMESTLGDTRKDTVVSQKFLDEQIAEYERRLIEAEDRLKEFKRKYVGMMPGTQGDYFQRLATAQNDLRQAKLALSEAENRRNELRRQLADAEAGGGEEEALFGMGDELGGTATSPEVAQLDARIQALEAKLDELLLSYTEKHPDVIGIRHTIAELQKRREEAMEKAAAAPQADPAGLAGGAGNELTNQLKLMLTEGEAQLAAQRARVRDLEARVEALKKAVDTVPEIEAEYTRLNRDYDLNKRNYQELLKRREAARLAQEAGETAEQVKLKIIEPPRVPLTASGPKRLVLVSAVLLVALGVGAALAVLLSQLKPKFFTAEDIKAYTGLPVMGVVTMVQNRHHRAERRMELATFSLVLLLLVAAYGGLVALQAMNIDLHERISAVVERVRGAS